MDESHRISAHILSFIFAWSSPSICLLILKFQQPQAPLLCLLRCVVSLHMCESHCSLSQGGGPTLTQDWPRVHYGHKCQRWPRAPLPPFLPGIWIPPSLGSGFLWAIYLFKHGWFLESKVSGFKVGDQGKQKVGGLDKRAREREGRNPPTFISCL